MMQQARIAANPKTPLHALSNGTSGRAVQRKCACGGSSAGAAECEACADKKQKELQRYSADRESLTGLAHGLSAAGAASPDDFPKGSGIVAGHSFGRVPLFGGAALRLHKKPYLGDPGRRFELEADRVA